MEQHRRRTWERLLAISSEQTGLADGRDTRCQKRLEDVSGVGEKTAVFKTRESMKKL